MRHLHLIIEMPLGITSGKVIRRLAVYIGLASAFLAVCALVIILEARTGVVIPARWVALGMWTLLLFYITARQNREYWARLPFWLALLSLLAIHLLGFIVLLRKYSEWRSMWFIPIVIVEAGVLSTILDALLSSKAKNTSHSASG